MLTVIHEMNEEPPLDTASSSSPSRTRNDENVNRSSVSTIAVQTKLEVRIERASQTSLLQYRETSQQTSNNLRVKDSLTGRQARSPIDWLEDPELDTVATQIQAGVRGMKARETMQKEEREINAVILKKNKEIEENLGIDLNDPEIIRATTKIQAGFRGFHARMLTKRPLTPAIFIHKPEESKSVSEDSEYSYTYTYEDEDEDDLEDDLEFSKRPLSPKTAVQDYPGFTIGGFTATFGLR